MVTGCIYKITCKVNGKVYIGQTIQKLESRLYYHFADAKKGKHQHAFSKAIRKHGEDNFTIEEVEKHTAPNKVSLKPLLDAAEREHIKKNNSYLLGYNSTLGGEGTLGHKLSDEHKRKIYPGKGWTHTAEARAKISMAQSGRVVTDEMREHLRTIREQQVLTKEQRAHIAEVNRLVHAKRVAQYDLYGNLVSAFNSVREAAEASGVSESAIGGVCSGKRQRAGMFFFAFIDSELQRSVDVSISSASMGNAPKAVEQRSKAGEIIATYRSIWEASANTKVRSSSIVENCKGKRKSAGGYVWCYG